MKRRGFLKGIAGILAAGVAPAVIGSEILMPVKDLWKPRRHPGFEEGIWTPSLMQEGVTYQTQHGRYIRIGNIVHVTGTIILASAPGALINGR